MKLVFVPLDSVRLTPDDVALLRENALVELYDLRAKEWQVIGQHIVTSADHTVVWLVFVMEK